MRSLMIMSGAELKDLRKMPLDKRQTILKRKQDKFIDIYRILSGLINRTDSKATKLTKRYYKTLYYIYDDILNIRVSIFDEGNGSENIEGFVHFEDTHRVFLNTLLSYQEKFREHLTDEEVILSTIKKMTPEEIINLFREPLLDKRLGFRRYKSRKR